MFNIPGQETFIVKKTLAVLVFFGLLSGFLFGQDRGLQVIAAENLGASVNIGKQYALFIAIDAYRSWPALKKPVADAREIRDILKQNYYIDEVIELYNQQATRANIARTFTDLQAKLGIHDSLFIYYAGHGHYDESSDAGFWIPVDGGTDRHSQENWLPNSQIRGYISRLKTIHVFMVSDACFSGDILNTTRSIPPQIDNAYYRKAYALTSRQVLTSGSSETVPDQSEFAAALINCLRKNTGSFLDPHSIYNDVRLSVRKTTPLYGTLNASSHQDGATFLFFRKQSQPAASAQPVVTPSPETTISTAVGNVTITSEIAGIIMIDGEATSSRIKAGGTVTVSNIGTGATEVAVMSDDGKITKLPQSVMVRQGQTVTASIKATATTAAAAVSNKNVPSDSIVVFPGNGHRYEVINTSKTWTAARDDCIKRGGYLATITSAEEQKFIEELLSNQGKRNQYWLGGYRPNKDWRWVTDEPFVYKNWGPGQPNNRGGDANRLILNLGDSRWSDMFNFQNVQDLRRAGGEASFGYICEWD